VKSVAILGASADRSKYGNKAVRAYLQQGYTVFPINPKGGVIEGLRVYRTIADLPTRPDRVSVYLQPEVTLKVLPDVLAKGCDELWLNPGADSEEVVAEAERLGLTVVRACSILEIGVSPSGL